MGYTLASAPWLVGQAAYAAHATPEIMIKHNNYVSERNTVWLSAIRYILHCFKFLGSNSQVFLSAMGRPNILNRSLA